ncbi:MAG TPA: hypothetical protein VNO70_18535, partial [Blastocatellia bacterium]|nr:hypothetical protein [Blastocatellia bacterium]
MSSIQRLHSAYNRHFAIVCSFGVALLAVALVTLAGPNLANTQPPGTSFVQAEDADKPHVLAASYYSLKGNLQSTLTLNNKGAQAVAVQPTLYSLAGARRDAAPVTVEARSYRVVDLRDLVAPMGIAFQEGSLQLFYRGHDLMLGAQVRMVDAERSLTFDEQLVEPAAMFASARLEGVWWLPSPHGAMQVALSNTTDFALAVTASITGAGLRQPEPVTMTLAPRETRVLDAQRDLSGDS